MKVLQLEHPEGRSTPASIDLSQTNDFVLSEPPTANTDALVTRDIQSRTP
jgi:hypothetical protein